MFYICSILSRKKSIPVKNALTTFEWRRLQNGPNGDKQGGK